MKNTAKQKTPVSTTTAKHFKKTFELVKKQNKRVMLSELQDLYSRVGNAINAVCADEEVDERLVANAGGLTAYMAKYNLLRNWTPYVEEVE